MECPMRRLPALSLLACLLLAACDRAPAPASAEPRAAGRSGAGRAGRQPAFAALRLPRRAGGAGHRSRCAAPWTSSPLTVSGCRPRRAADDHRRHHVPAGRRRDPPGADPAGLLEQWRNPLPADALPAELQAEDLGSQSLDGVETRHYRLRGAQPGERLEYWVDAQGLPRQIVRSGSSNGRSFQLRLRYSRFNDPALRVDLP
jgi:hypothetical protein